MDYHIFELLMKDFNTWKTIWKLCTQHKQMQDESLNKTGLNGI